MQIELKRLQSRLGITFVFVTHDQEEALVMSDRIAVMNRGRVEQLGDVAEIYHRPQTSFVASFLGQANVLNANVSNECLRIDDSLELKVSETPKTSEVLISIRPEKIAVHRTRPAGENVFEAQLVEEIFRGAMTQLLLCTPSGLTLTALAANEGAGGDLPRAGMAVFCQIHPDDIVIVR